MESWEDLEKKTLELFKLKGFPNAKRNVHKGGRQTDVFLSSTEEYVGDILIECKYTEKSTSIGVREVEDFISRVIRLRNKGEINCGYMITNSNYTSPALGLVEGNPEKKYVFLRTYDEMMSNLINFDYYLERFILEYESNKIVDLYEPLDVKLHNSRIENKISFENAINGFLDSNDNLLILLGDYGTGKTTSCKRTVYELAKRRLMGERKTRIPLFIPLLYFNHANAYTSLLSKFLNEDVCSSSNVKALLTMNKIGEIILFLDGFDEMARRVTQGIRNDAFRELAKLINPNSKIIISGRPGYFHFHKEFLSTLDSYSISDRIEQITSRVKGRKTDIASKINIFDIQPLTEEQIQSFLRSRITRDIESTNIEVELVNMMTKIHTTYNLAELATRPILLEMISTTLMESGTHQIYTPADLYERYTDAWLTLDTDKGDFRTLITSDDRLRFALSLAYAQVISNDEGIHYYDLNRLIGKYYEIEEAEEVDHYSSDVRTCNFLIRDDDGTYQFAHQSFLEYFFSLCLKLLATDSTGEADELISLLTEGRDHISILEVYDRIPNAFQFFYWMTHVPFSPKYWSRMKLMIEDVIAYTLYIERFNDNDMINLKLLAEGGFPIYEIHSMYSEADDLYRRIGSIIDNAILTGKIESQEYIEDFKKVKTAYENPLQ